MSLGGGVETAGTNASSGGIFIDSPGLVVTQNLHAPGAAIVVHGAGGVSIGGDVSSAGTDRRRRRPGPITSGGGIDLASSSGDVSVLGSIASFGRDMAGAGAIPGGHGGPVTVAGGDVHISGGIDSSPAEASTSPRGSPAASRLQPADRSWSPAPSSASGDISTSGYGSDGAAITMTAAGALAAGSIARRAARARTSVPARAAV